MHAAHVSVHVKNYRNLGAFAWLDDHRTDGRKGRSTALHNFNIGSIRNFQLLITDVG